MEGLVKVIGTDPLTSMAKKVSKLMDADIELKEGIWSLHKERTAKADDNSTVCDSWSMDLTVTYNPFDDNGEAINEAKVCVLPEEMPIFTRALMRHPISFPSNFSQRMSTDGVRYCIQLRSIELPENFAIRLSDSLNALF